jgi:hypothetical protein
MKGSLANRAAAGKRVAFLLHEASQFIQVAVPDGSPETANLGLVVDCNLAWRNGCVSKEILYHIKDVHFFAPTAKVTLSKRPGAAARSDCLKSSRALIRVDGSGAAGTPHQPQPPVLSTGSMAAARSEMREFGENMRRGVAEAC